MNGRLTLTNALVNKGYKDEPAFRVREGEKDGKPWIFVTFSVGVRNDRKDADGKYGWTNYTPIEASSGTARFLLDCADAGTRLNMILKVEDEHYEKDGERKTIKKYKVESVEIASGGKEKEGTGAETPAKKEESTPEGFMDIPADVEEELPFA